MSKLSRPGRWGRFARSQILNTRPSRNARRLRLGQYIESLEDRTLLAAGLLELSLVQTASSFDAGRESQGEVISLPESVPFIHEWNTFRVEVWASTPDGTNNAIAAASFTLDYDTNFFTPLNVFFNGPFVPDASPVIDDAAEQVTVSTIGLRTDAGDDARTLVATVQFSSQAGDQALFDAANHYAGPYDLGISLSSAQVELVSAGAVATATGDAPPTGLYALPFDTNNDQSISLVDVVVFASAFGKSLSGDETGTVWASDYNKDLSVSLSDLVLLAANFSLGASDGDSLVVPGGFPNSWQQPDLTIQLTNDTAPGGGTDTDGITSDPTIAAIATGNVAAFSEIVEFHARIDGTAGDPLMVLDAGGLGGLFTFDSAALAALNADTSVPDGEHVLYVRAVDALGNHTPIHDITFTLDATSPGIAVDPHQTARTPTETRLEIEFDEPIVPTTLSAANFLLKDASANSVNLLGLQLSPDNLVLELTFDPVASELHELVFDTTGVADAAGNSFSQSELLLGFLPSPLPTAEDDDVGTDEDTLLAGNVMTDNGNGADSDPEGGAISVVSVGGGTLGSPFALPSGALLTVNSDGTFSYDPNGQFESFGQGESNEESFAYTISDAEGGIDTATVTVTVNGINDTPALTVPTSGSVNEGSEYAASGSFNDPDDDTLAGTVDFGDGTGVQALTLNPDGTFGLIHTFDDDGTFTVTVSLSDDDVTTTKTFNVVAANVDVIDIAIDGNFDDWAEVQSYTDAVDDQHDTDHNGAGDTPGYVDHPDVDLLTYKATHDAENFYFFFESSGEIGRTQVEDLDQDLRAGRYYVIVTIDVDDDDVTGYPLHEGGYYPTTDGYDMNGEIEFFGGSFNTGHYLQHGANNDAELEQAFAEQSNNQYVWGGPDTQGPFEPGFVKVLPGSYDYYTQWVYKENDPAFSGNDSVTFVQDKGPVVVGNISQAISSDGHKLEMVVPYNGFLVDENGDPIIAPGKTVDFSFSLEASGELSNEVSVENPNGMWASDTADPIEGYFLTDPNAPAVDFGDAPAPYKTLLPDGGARHRQAAGLHLGSAVNSEANGQPSSQAAADKYDDGVTLSSAVTAGADVTGSVVASGAGFLSGWIDYNADGDWDDDGEHFIDDQALVAGSNALSFHVPDAAQTGGTYARLRFSSVSGLDYFGEAVDGEVEDYFVTIGASSVDLSIETSSAASSVFQASTLTYQVTVTNDGPVDVFGATVLDTISDSLSNVTWSAAFSGGATGDATGSGILNEQINLPTGSSVVYTIVADVNADAKPFVLNSARVDVGPFVTDNDLSNNASYDADSVALGTSPSLNVFVPGSAPAGIDTSDPIKEGAFGDLNQDGWIDAVFAHVTAGHQVWLNDGAGNLVNTNQSLGVDPSPVPSHHALGTELGDLDNDGDLDLLIINKAVQAVWLNDGTGMFPGVGIAIPGIPVSESYEVELADLDGDGDLDAVASDDDGTTFGGDGANLLLFNDGTGTFSQVVSLAAASDLDTWDTAVGDFDGDGSVDLVFANFNAGQPSEIWFNDGSGTFTKGTETFGGKQHWNVEVGDLDGDGDLDIMWVVKTAEPDYAEIWFNDGTGQFTVSSQRTHTTEDGLGGIEGLQIGDLDGDGDLDAFMSTYGPLGAILVWQNDGDGNFSVDFESTFILPDEPEQEVGGWRSRLADVDGDGDLDAFVFEGEHELLHYFENSNSDDAPTALDTYVATPDASYGYSLESTLSGVGYTAYVLDMTSQTWRTAAEVDKPIWKHWVTIIVPDGADSKTAVLFVDGGSNNNPAPVSVDPEAVAMALSSGLISIHLPTVPSEPLIFLEEGLSRSEDEIIAYTFNEYLESGDEGFPLLLPMVKSAVAAMNTAQNFGPGLGTGSFELDDFIVTGASKRGWTTWLTAAADPRVKAIVPFVIDMLNSDESMVHHKENYIGVTDQIIGGYSDAVHDYVDLNIMDRLTTPDGQELMKIVDPFEYRDRLTLPKYLVNGAGDEFFVPDSSQLYFDDLPGPTYLRYVPNVGHGLNADALEKAINFFSAIDAGSQLPELSWTIEGDGEVIRANTADTPTQVTLWQATNLDSLDFRISTFGAGWTGSPLADSGGGEYVAQVSFPASGGTAFFAEFIFDVDGLPITFTTQVSIVKPVVAELVFEGNSPQSFVAPSAISAAASGSSVVIDSATATAWADTDASGKIPDRRADVDFVSTAATEKQTGQASAGVTDSESEVDENSDDDAPEIEQNNLNDPAPRSLDEFFSEFDDWNLASPLLLL